MSAEGPRPREYDPYVSKRLPDMPPRDLERETTGRWTDAEKRAAEAKRGATGGRGLGAERRARIYGRVGAGPGGWLAGWGSLAAGMEPNRYGFLSKAQELYPTVFGPVDKNFWRSMSDEERQEMMRRQAAAQERVGFENSAPKMFIGDVKPEIPAGDDAAQGVAESLTEADIDYSLKRKYYQQRRQELEEIRQGKRKRIARYTQGEEGNDPVLALPSVLAGIKATPEMKWMLPAEELPQLAPEAPGVPGAAVNSAMPFHEGMGDKHIEGAQKHPLVQSEAEGGTFYVPAEPAVGGRERRGPDRRQSTAPYDGPERRTGQERRRPEPQYGRPSTTPPTQKLSGKAAQIESSNTYGLKSRSEMNYPQAYAPVSREMWSQMSEEQRSQVMRTQAIAQEKVGFEKGAPKYFIQDFDPSDANAPSSAPAKARQRTEVSEVGMAAPRLITGGVLIGIGLAVAGLGLSGLAQLPVSFAAGGGAVAIVAGVLLTLNPRG